MPRNTIPEYIAYFGDEMSKVLAERREKSETQNIIDYFKDKEMTPATMQEFQQMHPDVDLRGVMKLAPVVSEMYSRQQIQDIGANVFRTASAGEVDLKDQKSVMDYLKGLPQSDTVKFRAIQEAIVPFMKQHQDLIKNKYTQKSRNEDLLSFDSDGKPRVEIAAEELPVKEATTDNITASVLNKWINGGQLSDMETAVKEKYLSKDKAERFDNVISLAAQAAGIDVSKLRNGQLSPEEAESVRAKLPTDFISQLLIAGGAGGTPGGNSLPVKTNVGIPTQTGGNAPPANLLKEGKETSFKNGQVWTLKGGKQVRVR